MGCLNAGSGFTHWFANIHFSGQCNRSCFFCIGQWMPGQDMNNNLNDYPLKGYDQFMNHVIKNNVKEIYFTGTNTDPMLYKHIPNLIKDIRCRVPDALIGIRTNGATILSNLDQWNMFDEACLSITSFNKDIYKKTMGSGEPPKLKDIVDKTKFKQLKINIVLTHENTEDDILLSVREVKKAGIFKINLREPYGQSRIGNPLKNRKSSGSIHGMPIYIIEGVAVVYWDVHFVEVESINLYADGHISFDYSVTKGHSIKYGDVQPQENFGYGRQRKQWIGTKSETRSQYV